MYSYVDIALLNGEWAAGLCPTCGAARPGPDDVKAHNPGCEHDLALGERNFHTQAEREAARRRIVTSSGPTLPPPPGAGSL